MNNVINIFQWAQNETNREKLTPKAEFHALKVWHNALEAETEAQENSRRENISVDSEFLNEFNKSLARQ